MLREEIVRNPIFDRPIVYISRLVVLTFSALFCYSSSTFAGDNNPYKDAYKEAYFKVKKELAAHEYAHLKRFKRISKKQKVQHNKFNFILPLHTNK